MAQLWSASERGDARAVAALLDGDRTSVAVNHAGEWGWTPLFVASERGYVKVVSMGDTAKLYGQAIRQGGVDMWHGKVWKGIRERDVDR